MSEVTIVDYEARYAPDFKSLNVEWIQKYFTLEEHDLMELENPEEFILSKGGNILFAKSGDEVVGTCALIKTGGYEFYLAKMGVAPAFQGKQKVRKEYGWSRTGPWCRQSIYTCVWVLLKYLLMQPPMQEPI